MSLKDRLFLIKEKKHLVVWREMAWFYVLLIMLWGIYRLFFRFPILIEEVFFKALVFGLPVWWLARRNKWSLKSIGISGDGFFQSVYLGLGLGVILGFLGQLGNVIRHGTLVFEDFGLTSEMMGGFIILSLVTAFWEELVFMGYFLKRMSGVIANEQHRVIIIGLLFSFLHVPALWIQGMPMLQIVISLLLLTLLGMGNAILMLRQKNLIAPIMSHALWGVAVFLFR